MFWTMWISIPPVTTFTKEIDLQLAKRPLKTNGHLASFQLTSLVKEATGAGHDIGNECLTMTWLPGHSSNNGTPPADC